MYHEVQPDSFDMPAWTVVKESDFKWQIEYLRSMSVVVFSRAEKIGACVSYITNKEKTQ